MALITEHARLKEHVSSMSGNLEAQVFEGGKSGSLSFAYDSNTSS